MTESRTLTPHERHMQAVRAVQRRGELQRIQRAIRDLERLERAGIALTGRERGQLKYLRKRRTQVVEEMQAAGQVP